MTRGIEGLIGSKIIWSDGTRFEIEAVSKARIYVVDVTHGEKGDYLDMRPLTARHAAESHAHFILQDTEAYIAFKNFMGDEAYLHDATFEVEICYDIKDTKELARKIIQYEDVLFLKNVLDRLVELAEKLDTNVDIVK